MPDDAFFAVNGRVFWRGAKLAPETIDGLRRIFMREAASTDPLIRAWASTLLAELHYARLDASAYYLDLQVDPASGRWHLPTA